MTKYNVVILFQIFQSLLNILPLWRPTNDLKDLYDSSYFHKYYLTLKNKSELFEYNGNEASFE